MEQIPLLSLTMKPCPQSPLGMEEVDNTVDTLVALVSQAKVYKCEDYLARRSSDAKPPDFAMATCVQSYDACGEHIDMVCREKMIDWSYRVIDHFRIDREIISLSFAVVDRFVDRCSCDRTAFKLACIASLYTAVKMFNGIQLSISTLVDLGRNEFSFKQIAAMERKIIETLDWRINPPTVQAFIHCLFQLIPPLKDPSASKRVYDRAIFFAELCILDYSFITQDRYMVAVACLLNGLGSVQGTALIQRANLQQQFLTKLTTLLPTVDTQVAAIKRLQGRLWVLYGYSAQLQQDEMECLQSTSSSTTTIWCSPRSRLQVLSSQFHGRRKLRRSHSGCPLSSSPQTPSPKGVDGTYKANLRGFFS